MSIQTVKESRPYLTFRLNDEVFGTDVRVIREIIDKTKITKIPQMPDFILGIINLRGKVVPVLDLRQKFNITATSSTAETCIVVIEQEVADQVILIGALVDSVQEVIELADQDIEPAPKIGTRLNADFIAGMGKKDGSFIIILKIDKVLSSENLTGIDALHKNENNLTGI